MNRSGPVEGSKVVVFGAGPIGLGAVIGFKARGAAHVVAVDVVANRLEKAKKVGADAVIDSSSTDVVSQLKELHGVVPGQFGLDDRPDSDVYLDATGAKPVIETIMRALKNRAIVTVVGVHRQPVQLDFQTLLAAEPDIRLAMGYPTEIFESRTRSSRTGRSTSTSSAMSSRSTKCCTVSTSREPPAPRTRSS